VHTTNCAILKQLIKIGAERVKKMLMRKKFVKALYFFCKSLNAGLKASQENLCKMFIQQA
jgi:hypothetical protein